MTAALIVLIVFLVIFLISLIRIRVIAEYNDNLILTVRLLFIKLTFTQKEKQKKKKKKPKGGKKTSGKKGKGKSKNKNNFEKENKNALKTMLRKQGLNGLIEILKNLISLAKGSLRYFFKHFIVDNFDIKVIVSGEDACDTAVQYGAVCAVIYPIVGQLAYCLDFRDYTADVLCNFDENNKTSVHFYLNGSVRIIFIVILLFKAAARSAITYLKIKFR